MNLLLALDDNNTIKEVDVTWYYEFDDLEMEDLGGIYKEELKRIKFHFVEGVDIF